VPLTSNGEGEFPWRVELSRDASVDPTLIEFRAKIKVTLIETSPEQERNNNRAAVAILGADESDEWFTIVKTK
jgi:hypothetical protein